MAKRPIRVGIVGVGNCDAGGNEPIPGLMNTMPGEYGIGDVEVVAAFGGASGKVGLDVADAIGSAPNNTERFAVAEPTGGSPPNAELKLVIWDSPDSAGVVVDAVRCVRVALDRGEGVALRGPSPCVMKSPPDRFTDDEAREMVRSFVAG